MTERSSTEFEEIKRNIIEVREDVKRSLEKAGRDENVTLMAATKTVSAELVNYAARECGLTDIGENRVQELLEKYDALDKERLRIHFIGSLQPNKVKYIIDKVCLIHSLDSVSLAREISKRASAKGLTMDALIEINVGREESKGGVLPENARDFANDVGALPGLRLAGLMTMAPNCGDPETYRGYFSEVKELFDEMKKEGYFKVENPILSMGMSDSFKTAVECGATLIRPGSRIFGKRNYPGKI